MFAPTGMAKHSPISCTSNKIPPPSNHNHHKMRRSGAPFPPPSQHLAAGQSRVNQKVLPADIPLPHHTSQLLHNGVSASKMLHQAAVTAYKDNCQLGRSPLRFNLQVSVRHMKLVCTFHYSTLQPFYPSFLVDSQSHPISAVQCS